MRIISWLRSIVADFFRADTDEREREAEQVRAELEELRTLALLAVAQARRTELELRELMAAPEPEMTRLSALVPRLEEERARADELLERYRQREEAEEERLERLGAVRHSAEISRRRDDLRAAIGRAGHARHDEELARLEDEARAEAHRLDVLAQLDAGAPADEVPAAPVGPAERDLLARARALLDESDSEAHLSQD